MAKLKMMALELVAPRSRKAELLDYLQRRGVVEAEIPEETDGLTFAGLAEEQAQTERQRTLAENALAVLARVAPEKKPLTAMLEPRQALTPEAFAEKTAALPGVLADCERILALEKEIADHRAELVRDTTLKAQMLPWKDADIPVISGHTARTAYLLGGFRATLTREALLTGLAAVLPETDCVEAEIVSADENGTCAVIFCLRDEAAAVEEALRGMGFARAPECSDKTPADYIAERDAEIAEGERKIGECEAALTALAGRRRDIEFALDAAALKKDKLLFCEKLPETERIFYLRGWLPAREAAKTEKTLVSRFDAAVEITEPPPDADVPVLLENNGFAAPLQNITGQYSLPGKNDIDPTGPMAFFYYFFFGMMLSDAGYGLIIALATGLVWLLRGKTLEPKMKNNVKMYFFCGCSTVFWGAMYGSWFGDAASVICREFLGKPGFNPLPPVWTDAVTDTMNVLIMCFILGLAHLFWGVCMKGWTDIKNGRKLDALFDTVPTFLTVVGIAPIFFGLFVQESIPENYSALGTVFYNAFMSVHTALKGVSTYILIAGVVLVILTA